MSLREYVDATVAAQLNANPGLSMQGHIAMLARDGHDGFMFREAVGRLFARRATMLEAVLQHVRGNPGSMPCQIRKAMTAAGRNANSVPGSLTLLHKRKLVRVSGPMSHRCYYPVATTCLPYTELVFAVLADGVARRFREIFDTLVGQEITHQQARNALVQLYQGGRISVRGPRHAYEYHLPLSRTGGPGVMSMVAVSAIRAANMWPATPTAFGPQLRIAA